MSLYYIVTFQESFLRASQTTYRKGPKAECRRQGWGKTPINDPPSSPFSADVVSLFPGQSGFAFFLYFFLPESLYSRACTDCQNRSIHCIPQRQRWWRRRSPHNPAERGLDSGERERERGGGEEGREAARNRLWLPENRNPTNNRSNRKREGGAFGAQFPRLPIHGLFWKRSEIFFPFKARSPRSCRSSHLKFVSPLAAAFTISPFLSLFSWTYAGWIGLSVVSPPWFAYFVSSASQLSRSLRGNEYTSMVSSGNSDVVNRFPDFLRVPRWE